MANNKNGLTVVNGANTAKTSSYKYYQNLTKQAVVYDGRKNETDFPEFVEICKATQKELIDLLPTKLEELGYEEIISGDGYIYARGSVPVLLTAHMDTVHTSRIVDFYENIDAKGNHILASPQGIGGDDRCGIYMILQIAKTHKCSILFCEDEEVGGKGSRKFITTSLAKELKELKYMIELDRANSKDAVFYSCDNKKFTSFICDNTGYKETWGSFSDISVLAPAAGIAAVNLSCGYYCAHQLAEKVNVEEMMNTIEVVKALLEVECDQFEYVKRTYGGSYSYGYGYSCDYDYDYDDWYNSYYRRNYGGGYDRNGYAYGGKYEDDGGYDYGDGYNGYGQSKSKLPKKAKDNKKEKDYKNEYDQLVLYVVFEDEGGDENEVYITGETKDNVWHKFFKEYSNICYNDVLDYAYDYI